MASGGREVEGSEKLILYSYWRSSCSARVRIALNFKGLDYEYKAVNLLKGEQSNPDFLKLNPLGYVPALVVGEVVVADSLAILMYLEEKYPQHPLLPQDLQKRTLNFQLGGKKVDLDKYAHSLGLQVANIVGSSIQPLQNIPVLKFINEKLGSSEVQPWAQSHIRRGFGALEKLLKDFAGKYATGDDVFLADVFLAPQIHGAINRFQVDMDEFPTILRIFHAYMELPAFKDAMPEKQPDTPPEERA